ncbi:MAG: quinate 5-dehydrogenase [Sporomusaceae bacterium]|nr:quinate 5-dehydrogenase [Sporomusaceae bacterium]
MEIFTGADLKGNETGIMTNNHILSVSLGSSERNHCTTEWLEGKKYTVERRGVDGDKKRAIELIQAMDGRVAAFGLGGTDLYIYAGNRRYRFYEAAQIAKAAVKSPLVDGSGIKNTLERRVLTYLEQTGFSFQGKKVLLVCAVDRFGLAEAFVQAGCQVVFGDLLFGLGWPVPIRSLKTLARLAFFLAPIITKLPVGWFYPMGKAQIESKPRYSRFFEEADIIAGDFHFIRRYMPLKLAGKLILTNTVTQDDLALLAARGAATVVTTTPSMGGRSFGTNILEALLVAHSGRWPKALTPLEYLELMERLQIQPRIVHLS